MTGTVKFFPQLSCLFSRRTPGEVTAWQTSLCGSTTGGGTFCAYTLLVVCCKEG